MKRTLLTLAMLATAAPLAYAQPAQLRLGEPSYGGNGCPGGSVGISLAPDGSSLSLLFDSFQVSAGGTTGRSFERKSCNVSIPVEVPQGLSVSIINVDYRGFNQLPPGASSNFTVEYFFASGRGPVFNRSFTGPLADEYLIQNQLIGTALVWSACGQDVLLRANSAMRVQTSQNQEALATVDSEDVSAALIFSLQWRQC